MGCGASVPVAPDPRYSRDARNARGAAPPPAKAAFSPRGPPGKSVASPRGPPAKAVTSPRGPPAKAMTSPRGPPAKAMTSPRGPAAKAMTSPRGPPAKAMTSPRGAPPSPAKEAFKSPKGVGTFPASSRAPPPPPPPHPPPQNASGTAAGSVDDESRRFADYARVQITGIEKRPELNGQSGVVMSYEGGIEKRYVVRVNGSSMALRESKLMASDDRAQAKASRAEPKASAAEWRNSRGPQVASKGGFMSPSSVTSTSTNAGSATPQKTGSTRGSDTSEDPSMKNGSGRSDAFSRVGGGKGSQRSRPSSAHDASSRCSQRSRPSSAHDASRSDKRSRPSSADPSSRMDNLPLGQVNARGSLVPTYHWVKVPDLATLPPGLEVWMSLDKSKCARIPATWRLQILAEEQIDTFRENVKEHTPIAHVIKSAAVCFGWDERSFELRADGQQLSWRSGDTVGSLSLFGRKLSARKQA
eukprot:TRINITY_DN2981_c0_g1_i1.p1 TRINITY_DN2981_c0_g1~~TRINITY_DN2981_c0_g1_i1.p1  ORF type:complete len:471 (+),score=15.12 TRINITY_DN2981_c0_g1_i1:89-1501(+)